MSDPAAVAIISETPDRAPPPLDHAMLRVMVAVASYHARRVARTIGLDDTEREDVEQEILLTLLERRRFFDPVRGAWSAFADRVGRQAAQSLADGIVAWRRRHQPMTAASDHDGDEHPTNVEAALQAQRGTGADPLEELQLPAAVARFVAELPPELALVARFALEEDGDLAEAQRRSMLSTSEFYRRLREIRVRLVCAGIVRKRFGSGGASAVAPAADGSAPP